MILVFLAFFDACYNPPDSVTFIHSFQAVTSRRRLERGSPMSHEYSGANPGGPPVASVSGAASTAKPTDAGMLAPLRFLAMAVLAGFVAGLASWGVGEAAYPRFVSSLRVDNKQFDSMEKQTNEKFRLVNQGTTYRAMVSYGAMGATLGVALGLIGGLARRSATTGLMAAGLGLVLGGAAGACVTQAVLPTYFHLLRTSEDHLSSNITVPLLIHGGIWTACGLAGGLALGLGLGGLGRAVQAGIGGALGAMIGTFLYEFTGPFVFPAAATSEPIANDRLARLLAHLSVAIFVALGAAWSARYLSPKRATKTTQAD